MYPGVQYLNGAQQLHANGQMVTATNWFPAPTQTTGKSLLGCTSGYHLNTVSTNEGWRYVHTYIYIYIFIYIYI